MFSSKISEYDLDNSVFNGLAQESSVQEVITKLDAIGSSSGGGNRTHGTAEFTTAGSHTWICPEGVFSVLAFLLSGSGGGAGGSSGTQTTTTQGGAGGGGQAGNLVIASIQVNPGESYTISVGSGGSKGAAATSNGTLGKAGGDGGSTSFGGVLSVPGGSKGAVGNDYKTGGSGGSRSKSSLLSSLGVDYSSLEVVLKYVAVGSAGNNGESGVQGSSYRPGNGGAGGSAINIQDNLNYIGFPCNSGGSGGKGANGGAAASGAAGSPGRVFIKW